MASHAPRNIRRLATELAADRATEPMRIEPAVVATVVAGGADDGNARVSLTWRGGTVQAPYLAAYTPVVGHVVAVAVQPGQLLILGRIIGTP